MDFFFGYATKKITHTLVIGLSSQLAKYFGSSKKHSIKIIEQHFQSPLYGQAIQIKRGKVYKRIIDPVAYRILINLNINQHSYPQKPYCYTEKSKILALSKSSFIALGKDSFLGFRCTSGCELHHYFQTDYSHPLSATNFTVCSKIYQAQPNLD